MKCHSAQKKMLLLQSGELPGFSRFRLSRHLKRCEDCRRQREQIDRLCSLARTPASAQPPLEGFRLEQILSAARYEQKRANRSYKVIHETTIMTWSPAILYSSISILLLTGFLLVMRPMFKSAPLAQTNNPPAAADTAWDDDFETRYVDLDAQLALAASDGKDSAPAENDSKTADALASELLKLEGSAI